MSIKEDFKHLEICEVLDAYSAQQMLAIGARQNLCCRHREFWRALASTHSVEHASGVMDLTLSNMKPIN